MRDIRIDRDNTHIHARVDGTDSKSAPTIVFANSLGTTLHMWDPILPHLPSTLRIIRFDMRGHGNSGVPPAPYAMGTLISDAEAVCDALGVRDCVFVGLSVGGMVAQGLAVKRLDVVRALVLSNTAAKVGNPDMWRGRIESISKHGMEAVADAAMERFFGPDYLHTPDVQRWRDMFTGISPVGYAGVAAAISGTDFYTPTSGSRLPTLGIASAEDKATPPDLVRETINLIPGSQFKLLRRAGHLPCIEQPAVYATLLTDFLHSIGHI